MNLEEMAKDSGTESVPPAKRAYEDTHMLEYAGITLALAALGIAAYRNIRYGMKSIIAHRRIKSKSKKGGAEKTDNRPQPPIRWYWF